MWNQSHIWKTTPSQLSQFKEVLWKSGKLKGREVGMRGVFWFTVLHRGRKKTNDSSSSIWLDTLCLFSHFHYTFPHLYCFLLSLEVARTWPCQPEFLPQFQLAGAFIYILNIHQQLSLDCKLYWKWKTRVLQFLHKKPRLSRTGQDCQFQGKSALTFMHKAKTK